MATAWFCFAPKGVSMAGIRQATGADEPASIGNFSSREISTIRFACRKFQERCLSLKTGTAAAGLAEDIGDLEEHLEARIELLLFVVDGIVAVLANQQHAIDGELVAAQRERVGDGAEDRHIILLRRSRLMSCLGICSVNMETIFERG